MKDIHKRARWKEQPDHTKRAAGWAVVLAVLMTMNLSAECQWNDPTRRDTCVNWYLPFHEKVLDNQKPLKLAPWNASDPNNPGTGYDNFMNVAWDFLVNRVKLDERPTEPDGSWGTGLRAYLVGMSFAEDNTPGGWQTTIGGGLTGEFVESLVNGWYAFTQERKLANDAAVRVQEMLDFAIENRTDATWDWPNVPRTVGCAGYAVLEKSCIQDVERTVPGLETDKIAEFGLGALLFYQFVGDGIQQENRKYLDVALNSARQLARPDHIRAFAANDPRGHAQMPWPFRVNAYNGEVLTTYWEPISDISLQDFGCPGGDPKCIAQLPPPLPVEYGGAQAHGLRLLQAFIRAYDAHPDRVPGMTDHDRKQFELARDIAWEWFKTHQLNQADANCRDIWSLYYEDINYTFKTNLNQVGPTIAAYYILDALRHGEEEVLGHLPLKAPATPYDSWYEVVRHLIDWTWLVNGRGPDPEREAQYTGQPPLFPERYEYFWNGAHGVDEQRVVADNFWGCCSLAGQVAATSRWAGVGAIYSALDSTGLAPPAPTTGSYKEDAFRTMNYVTYFLISNEPTDPHYGQIPCCGLEDTGDKEPDPLIRYQPSFWFTDSYADNLRHFMWLLGALPEFAPKNESRILYSTSIIMKDTVAYGTAPRIKYATFSPQSVEKIRVNFPVARVTAGGKALTTTASPDGFYTVSPLGEEGTDFLLTVTHYNAGEVEINP